MKIPASLSVIATAVFVVGLMASPASGEAKSATVPFVLDHNRMLVEASIDKSDGTTRKIRLWVDTGNPDFFLTEELAGDLGMDLSSAKENRAAGQPLEVPPPEGIRIGGMPLDFTDVKCKVMFQPRWIFDTMHNDANLPSTVLRRYRVIFDYPAREMTIAEPGTSADRRGAKTPASIHPQTGIVQIDGRMDEDSVSFALDIGASYSYTSANYVERLIERHPDWSRCRGAVGCANIWGWWPQEQEWPVVRVPAIEWGSVRLTNVGLAGLPNFFPNGTDIGVWYSQKTARPVVGFLGPNALVNYRVEIDYAGSAVYLEKKTEPDARDMDIVGLTIRLGADGVYEILGSATAEGASAVEGVKPGDRLLRVGELETKGATMGVVADALRGKPGDIRVLILEREGKRLRVEARVERYL